MDQTVQDCNIIFKRTQPKSGQNDFALHICLGYSVMAKISLSTVTKRAACKTHKKTGWCLGCPVQDVCHTIHMQTERVITALWACYLLTMSHAGRITKQSIRHEWCDKCRQGGASQDDGLSMPLCSGQRTTLLASLDASCHSLLPFQPTAFRFNEGQLIHKRLA